MTDANPKELLKTMYSLTAEELMVRSDDHGQAEPDIKTLAYEGSTDHCTIHLQCLEGEFDGGKTCTFDINRDDIPRFCYLTGHLLSRVLSTGGVALTGRLVKTTETGETVVISTHETKQTMVTPRRSKATSSDTQHSSKGTWFIPALCATELDLGGSMHSKERAMEIDHISKTFPSPATLDMIADHNLLTQGMGGKHIFSPDGCHHCNLLESFLNGEDMRRMVNSLQEKKPIKSLEDPNKAEQYHMRSHLDIQTNMGHKAYHMSRPLYLLLQVYLTTLHNYIHVTIKKTDNLHVVFEPVNKKHVIPPTWEFSGSLILFHTSVKS